MLAGVARLPLFKGKGTAEGTVQPAEPVALQLRSERIRAIDGFIAKNILSDPPAPDHALTYEVLSSGVSAVDLLFHDLASSSYVYS
jgi:hypothetical protein